MKSADSIELEVQYACDDAGLPTEAHFREWAAAALRGRAAELCIRVVDEEEGRELNRRYRGKDSATNVLSFPVELPEGVSSRELGDVVICAPVVSREAQRQGKDPGAHWAHLAVHGILHLLGHDHQDARQADAMEALETRVLAGLGFPDPHDPDKLETVKAAEEARKASP